MSDRRSWDSPPFVQLRWWGLIEGLTLILLLGVAVPLKRLLDWPLGSSIMGPIHGLAFVIYLASLIETFAAGMVSRLELLRGMVASMLPFGTFIQDRLLRKKYRPTS